MIAQTMKKGLLLGSLLALTAACGPAELDGGPDGGGDDGTDGSGGGAQCADPALCNTGVQLTPEDARATCDSSRAGPRVLRRLTQGETNASIIDIFPEIAGSWTGVKLSADPMSKLGFTNDASVLVVGGSTARELQKTAEEVGDLISADGVLPNVLPCATSSADAACVTDFVTRYGLRLFRRPVAEDEIKRYVDYHQSVAQRSDFKTAIKWTLSALIQSPHSIYRTELGEPSGSGYALTQHELATELAYTYTGSTPDQTLLDAAASGSLSDPAALRAQAARLLGEGSPRRFDAVNRFFLEWLEYAKVLGASRVASQEFADEITPLMVEETRLFLLQLVYADGADVADLLKANYTVVNPKLASFYGFGELSDWGRVERPADRGVGILAQGSLLAGTSHQEYTSPTLRGLLYYRKFLCNSKPPVPAFVPSLEETSKDTDAKTTREKFEAHHAKGACATCHEQFEPFGYNFEQFDETGRYRADEKGYPLDTVSTVILPDGSERQVSSLEDLAALVDVGDHVDNCVSGLMAAYAFSGGGGQGCLAEPQRKAIAAGEMSMYDFLLELTQAPHFTTRR